MRSCWTDRPKTTVCLYRLLLALLRGPQAYPIHSVSRAVYLVTDLCVGGELFDRICAKSYFLEEDAAKLVRTVMSAVEYLHSHGIVHRGQYHDTLQPRPRRPTLARWLDFA